jgi:hypothetical protein
MFPPRYVPPAGRPSRGGLAVVVLGVMHDLGPLLGRDTEYLRVELAAVRETMGR